MSSAIHAVSDGKLVVCLLAGALVATGHSTTRPSMNVAPHPVYTGEVTPAVPGFTWGGLFCVWGLCTWYTRFTHSVLLTVNAPWCIIALFAL